MQTTEQLNAALEGRYAIVRLVGEGGMATVYLARDIRHNRRVALKVLKPDLGAVVGVERFLSEIQVTANLQHPNLLPLFDSGAADHLLFYVMPYIEGESLRARLEREKQLPVDEAIRIAASVASALDYAHRNGVIHRDLKPENILLHEGQPLVADFGIALAVSNAGGNRITQTGLSLGTPQYMSPEQATSDRAIDGRTDIYSLGALTYEMLTGEPPHTGSTSQAIIARLLTERPRRLRASRPSVPEHVEAAVECALEKLPADRWDTAKEFSEALTGARVVTRPTSVTAIRTAAETTRTASRRLPVREIVAWAVAVIAIGVAAFRNSGATEPANPSVPTEFEVQLPDDMDVLGRAGGANTIALSQDGSTLVVAASESGGRSKLYVRRLDDRDLAPIRGSDSAGVPSLSPNGEHVLFPARGPGQAGRGSGFPLKVLPVRGGTPRTVVDSGQGNGQVSWGDAGRLVLAFQNRLWTVPAEGGPRTLLASPDSARRHFRYGFPHVLPGGKAALITIWLGAAEIDSTVLGIVTVPDGEVTDLGIRGTNPQYSGTGHIVFATDASLFAVPFSERSRRVTGKAFPVVEGVAMGRGGAAGFAVARNGTLAYRTGDLGAGRGSHLLFAVTRAGAGRTLGAEPGFYGNPRVSPDGRQIAMHINARPGFGPGSFPDVWRFDTASKVLTRVTADSSSNYALWSRDGERIAYTRMGDDSAVYWQPLYLTGQATPLVKVDRSIRALSLPRAGAYAALRVGDESNFDIWLVHMDSLSSPRPFLAEAYGEMSPELSPDGRLIAYVTNRTGQNEVYVRRVPSGADEVRVSVSGGTEPVWAPNGRELFFRGRQHVMAARVNEGARLTLSAPDTLFRDVYGRNSNRSAYDIFPDGREFVMLRAGGAQTIERSRVIIMMNWHLRSRARNELSER
jgi:Tol biopolymer transport system component/tRNA A-37 threonylcarbamoyl transferase component Bud32